MKVLITGDKGYIGSHLAPFFPGYEGCDLKDGDKDYRYAFRDDYWDVLIHLAASVSVTDSFFKPFEYWDNNALGLGKFFATNYAKRVIFISTGGAMYGNNPCAQEKDAEYHLCRSPYAQSKFIAEEIIREETDNHCILRLANVFGGDYSIRGEAAVHAHFAQDNPIVVYGGNQTRDFISVEDVCLAIKRAVESDITGTFNIGSGVETPIIDLASEFSHQRGVPVEIRPERPGEVRYIALDITKAKQAGLL